MTSEIVVSNYFEELIEIIVKYGLSDKPHMIFNVDEKGISPARYFQYICPSTSCDIREIKYCNHSRMWECQWYDCATLLCILR